MSADEGGLGRQRLDSSTGRARDITITRVASELVDHENPDYRHAENLAYESIRPLLDEVDRLTRERDQYRGWHAEVRGESAKLRAENAALRRVLAEDGQ